MVFLVATTSLPAVYRPNDDHWNAARSCQLGEISITECLVYTRVDQITSLKFLPSEQERLFHIH